MSMVMLIICLVSVVSAFVSFLLNRRNPTKMRQRITWVLAVVSLLSGVTSGALGFYAEKEAKRQLELVRNEAVDARKQAHRARAQIAEVRTPRRMERPIMRMLVVRLKPYGGQKYDMQVFRDHDSLELARVLQAVLEEAGWVYTNVYPRHATRFAETREHGVWVMSGEVETTRTSKAREALRGVLDEAGLYDDSTAFTPVECVEATGPLQEGTKIKGIPCSESPVQITGIEFTLHDDVIPEDTLVLHVGKERLQRFEPN